MATSKLGEVYFCSCLSWAEVVQPLYKLAFRIRYGSPKMRQDLTSEAEMIPERLIAEGSLWPALIVGQLVQ